jgi:nucleoside-diphosphate-sugar epimerase
VEVYEGDLRDPSAVLTAVQGVDAILHLAPVGIFDPIQVDEQTALDLATRGTFVLMNAAREAGVPHVVVASTLSLFDRLPAQWRVNEAWRPRPSPDVDQLCAWLAELSARENARAGGPHVTCLRFGRIVDDAQAASQPFDPRWLHLDDAILGLRRALDVGRAVSPPSEAGAGAGQGRVNSPPYKVYHIVAGGPRAKIRLKDAASAGEQFGYQPMHDFSERWPQQTAAVVRDDQSWREVLAPQPLRVRARPIRTVAIFGAGGPVGAVTARELASSYKLRLADLRPIDDIIAEAKPQMPGAPLPTRLDAPHEYCVVDVRDPQQVMAACEGVDAIINLTVVRHDPVDAFRVNTLGAINVMRAAVAHGIRRVVHTGPLMSGSPGPGDYSSDYDLHVDAPSRPYDHLYIHSKYLGQEACRVFAENDGLEVPVLLFAAFVNPQNSGGPGHIFAVSWEDSARAIRRALEMASLPSPFELFNITVDLPQGRYQHDKAAQLLDWVPRDTLEHYWRETES